MFSSDGIRTFAIFIVLLGGLVFLFWNRLEPYISGQIPIVKFGYQQTQEEVAALRPVYVHLGIQPLAASHAKNKVIARALRDLKDSSCDKTAIFRLGNELAKIGEKRTAAKAFEGFAKACPNSEGELRAAANVLFGIGDYEAVIPLADQLVSSRPEVGQYYYLRAQALAYTKQYQRAVEDFSSAIALFDDIRRVRGRVFTQLADAYAKQGEYCQAMAVIQTYVFADAVKRNTAASRKLIESFAGRGQCDSGYAEGEDIIPRTSKDVMVVRASINGVKGNFVVDTGASMVALNPEFAKRANLGTENSRRIMVHTANGIAGATLTTAGEVQLGNARAKNVSAAILSTSLGSGLNGLLGMSFLARFDVSITERELKIKSR